MRQPDQPSAVRRAREFIHANFQKNISLGELQSVTGLSPWQLDRAFKAATGLPLHKYLTHLRVAKARVALAAGARQAEVDVGFFDQSHLTRHFKAAMGLTPGQYASCFRPSRRNRKNVQDNTS